MILPTQKSHQHRHININLSMMGKIHTLNGQAQMNINTHSAAAVALL